MGKLLVLGKQIQRKRRQSGNKSWLEYWNANSSAWIKNWYL
jgi:hypothetical protein